FGIPENYSSYMSGHNRASYLQLLKETILNGHAPEEVILLEIFPHQQKTRIDFYCTKDYVGIEPVCLTELLFENGKVYYFKDQKKIQIKSIYNRIIFDELQQQATEVQEMGKFLFQPLDVEWCPHPSWFYRISKYTIPLIRHPYVPETW